MNIGMISYGATVNVLEIAQEYHEKLVGKVECLGHRITNIENVVTDDDANKKAMEVLKSTQIDMLIVELGTFAQGNMLLDLFETFYEVPLFLRGYNDPKVPGFPTIPLNSLTGFIMCTSYLKRNDKTFSWAYEDVDNEGADGKLIRMIKAIYIKKKLRNKKYATIGSRAPGFYLCMVDELNFRRTLGPEILHVSLATIFTQADQIETNRIEETKKEIKGTVCIDICESQLDKNIRLFLAIKDYCEENKIDAVTMKCWPELQSVYKTAGCSVLSMLNNVGITACCEGDIQGLATMDIFKEFSNQGVFFADLVCRSNSGGLKAWHCGFGPHDLADNDITYTEQATMRNGIGVGVQYNMKLGRVTLGKLSERKTGFKLFLAEGTTVAPDRELLGVQTDIELDKGFSETLKIMVEEGFEHHYVLTHKELISDLEEFAKWTNLEIIK